MLTVPQYILLIGRDWTESWRLNAGMQGTVVYTCSVLMATPTLIVKVMAIYGGDLLSAYLLQSWHFDRLFIFLL